MAPTPAPMSVASVDPPRAWPSTAPSPAPMRAFVLALFSQPESIETLIMSPGRARYAVHFLSLLFIF